MSEAMERFKKSVSNLKKKPSDLKRILSLPCKKENTPDYTQRLKKPGGTWKLNDAQNALLHQALLNDGAIGAIGVGQGKTLASVLLTEVMQCERPLILIPAPMRKQIGVQSAEYLKQFHFDPSKIEVESYSMISQPGAKILNEYQPDLIIADECHKLSNKTSARTKRFIRYMRNNPETKFVGMTGTLFSKSIRDALHLVELALRNKTPMPLKYKNQLSWAACIDVFDAERMPDWDDWARVNELVRNFSPELYDDFKNVQTRFKQKKEIAREAFFNRFSTAPGVVHTIDSSCNAPIYMEEISKDQLKVPDALKEHLKNLEDYWELPNGDPIDSPLALARAKEQLTAGFYYHWVWPDGEIDYEWLECRRVYNAEVRNWCKRSKPGQDSPALVVKALEAGEIDHAPLKRAYAGWLGVADRPEPPTKTVWLDDYLVEDALHRAHSSYDPAIIWYTHRAVGERFEELGYKVYGSGTNPEALDESELIVCSQRAHGTGKELQKWHRQVVITPSSSGKIWEQLLGRMHRQGQDSDEIWVEVYQHSSVFKSKLDGAREDARFQQSITGQRQKLTSFVKTI